MSDEAPLVLAGQHIAVVIPAYDGKVPVELIQSLFGLSALLSANGAKMSFLTKSSCAIVHMARNSLLSEIMKYPDITGVLHVDGDVVFAPMDALKLIAFADDNYDVMAGLYRAKTDKHILYFASWTTHFDGLPLYDVNGVLPCSRVPFGFCYVKIGVLKALWDQAPVCSGDDQEEVRLVFDCPFDPVEKKVIGEDYTFCDKAVALGYKIGVVPDVRLKHIGPKAFEGSFKDTFDKFAAGEISVSDTDYRAL